MPISVPKQHLTYHLDTEAPDPALGLNPSVVEAYTKFVTNSLSEGLTIDLPNQSWPLPLKIQVRQTPKTLQGYSLVTSMGAYLGAYPTRKLEPSRMSCGHQDLHLKHEACPSSAVPECGAP